MNTTVVAGVVVMTNACHQSPQLDSELVLFIY